jgi:hypothetical protein
MRDPALHLTVQMRHSRIELNARYKLDNESKYSSACSSEIVKE